MIPLEDNFNDVLAKALQGSGWSVETAAKRSGLGKQDVQELLAGHFSEAPARAMAAALGLKADAVAGLARGHHHPEVEAPGNLRAVTTNFGDMTVNAYILWDAVNHDAAVFDTGAAAEPILEVVRAHELNVVGIFLTHSHADHIHALAELKHAFDTDAWSSEFEPVRGTRTFRPGDLFNAGRHFIRTRHTPGHSPGGATFVIEGATVAAAIVGDALFAGSIGGVRSGYAEALANIRREIMTLADDTILCPGHGPLTTVGLEKVHNPFL